MVIRETEGVIQFAYHLSPPRDRDRTRARAKALEAVAAPFREAGLLGRDPARYEGLAYGNVSVREGPGYAITASQRSDQATLAAEDACWVALQRGVGGRLEAEGDRPPSSESLVHEALYRACPRIQAIAHGHHPTLWRARDALTLLCTGVEARNGTVALAQAVTTLSKDREAGCLAMAGHEDGMLFWAPTSDALHQLLAQTLARLSEFHHDAP